MNRQKCHIQIRVIQPPTAIIMDNNNVHLSSIHEKCEQEEKTIENNQIQTHLLSSQLWVPVSKVEYNLN